MRLSDIGVEPFLVASTVEGVMAQRLVRTLCPNCREPFRPEPDDVPRDFPLEACLAQPEPIYRAAGCRDCRGTGYAGRAGLYELLVANEEIRTLANERTSSGIIKPAAIRAGMRTLRQDGWRKVLWGRTSVEEVLRVSKAD